MDYTFRTKGVCAAKIDFSVEDNIVKNVAFTGGCNGNRKAVAALVDGMSIDDIIGRVEGITCGFKQTSCCDQFAQALKQVKEEQ
jgi:uncharacterized protein (TIGR03905 family)